MSLQPSDLVVQAGGAVPPLPQAGAIAGPTTVHTGYYGNPWCEGGWKYTEDRFDSYAYWYDPRPRYRYWRR